MQRVRVRKSEAEGSWLRNPAQLKDFTFLKTVQGGGSFQSVERLGRQIDLQHAPSVEVKNKWSYTPTPPHTHESLCLKAKNLVPGSRASEYPIRGMSSEIKG